MSDVLFDTGEYSLKPGAREKLAKVVEVLRSYPGLKIEIAGYTDDVGGDAMNQILSEHRAEAVRDYVASQGMTNSVSAKGFGNTLPLASKETSAGRQQNRRVELLVSGDAIDDTSAPSRSDEPQTLRYDFGSVKKVWETLGMAELNKKLLILHDRFMGFAKTAGTSSLAALPVTQRSCKNLTRTTAMKMQVKPLPGS